MDVPYVTAYRENPAANGISPPLPLELAPHEYDQLETEGRRAGSKRAALLAGLAALSTLKQAEAAFAAAHAELDEARREVQALADQLQTAGRSQATAKATAAKQRKAADQTHQQLRDAHERIEALEGMLRVERTAHEDTLDEIHALRRQIVPELRCPRCRTYTPPTEWAAHDTPDGRLVYHKPCGYHPGGLLDATSVLGRRYPR